MSTKLFQKTVLNKIMVWEVSFSKEVLTYSWGYLNSDKIQSITESVKSVKQAKIVYDREIKKRIRNGYKENIKEVSNNDFSFEPLSKSFAPPKPISSKPSRENIEEIKNKGNFLAQKKYNGVRAFIVYTKNSVNLYSRKIKLMNDNFRFTEFFEKISDINLPDNTILDIELVLGKGDSLEEFKIINSMTPNTLPERSKSIYSKWLESNSLKILSGMLHNIIFYDGINMLDLPYRERLKYMEEIDSDILFLPQSFDNLESGIEYVKKKNCEGLVIYDLSATSEYMMNGKPKRPKGCWKWKIDKEDDFFITDVYPQSGNKKLVGGFQIAQYDENNNLINCGKVGSGINDDLRTLAWGWKNKVILVMFSERMTKNKKGEISCQFPRFICERKDKNKEECIYYP